MNRFPLVDGLPEVELQALRLDGEAYRVGGAHLPIGIPDCSASRAAAVLGDRTPRLIAARDTAAWIWAARSAPPEPAEFLVDLAARWRPQPSDGIEVIESVIDPDDVARFGEVVVTTPLRTTLDLARFRATFTGADAATIRALAAVGGFGIDEALRTMDRRRHLAGKRNAAERLRAALSPS